MMKSMLGVLAAIALLTSTAGAASGSKSHEETRPAQAKIKTIFDYKEDLGLTDAQVASIKAALVKLQESIQSVNPKVATAEQELQKLLDAEAALDQVEAKLKSIHAYLVQLKMEDIKTSRAINAILQPSQLEKWRKLQETTRARQAAAAKAAAAGAHTSPAKRGEENDSEE